MDLNIAQEGVCDYVRVRNYTISINYIQMHLAQNTSYYHQANLWSYHKGAQNINSSGPRWLRCNPSA